MDVRKYLVQTCVWKALTSDSSDEYGVSSYGEATTLKCFKWDGIGVNFGGGNDYKINQENIKQGFGYSYIVINNQVTSGDLLDDRVITDTKEYTDLNGNYLYTLCCVE